MLKIAVLSSNSPEDACGYLRVQALLDANSDFLAGEWACRRERKFLFRRTIVNENSIDSADVVLVQRLFPRKETRPILEKILKSGKPVVFDLDDLLTDIPADHPYRNKIIDKRPFIIDLLRRASAVTVSTETLRDTLLPYNDNTHVLPNLCDERLWSKKGGDVDSGRVMIVFGGTKSHRNDLALIEKPLAHIAAKYRDKVAFKFWGCVTSKLASLPNLEFLDFTSSYREYAEKLQGLAIDIALVPLADNLFNRCKSNIKWLEYSACGIAGIYSALPPYSSIEHGRSGLLAGAGTDEWVDALESLIDDADKRRLIAHEARNTVLSSATLAGGAARMRDFFLGLRR